MSVKKGIGGAGALKSKCEKSTYRSVGNLNPDEVRKKVTDLSNSKKTQAEIYTLEDMSAPLQKHNKHQEKVRTKLKQQALELGISKDFIKQIEEEVPSNANCGNANLVIPFDSSLLISSRICNFLD